MFSLYEKCTVYTEKCTVYTRKSKFYAKKCTLQNICDIYLQRTSVLEPLGGLQWGVTNIEVTDELEGPGCQTFLFFFQEFLEVIFRVCRLDSHEGSCLHVVQLPDDEVVCAVLLHGGVLDVEGVRVVLEGPVVLVLVAGHVALDQLQPVLPRPDVLEGGGVPEVPLALLLLLAESAGEGDQLRLALLALLVHRGLKRETQ